MDNNITAHEIIELLRERLANADSPKEGLQTFVDEDVPKILPQEIDEDRFKRRFSPSAESMGDGFGLD
jgi:hypothetical protein